MKKYRSHKIVEAAKIVSFSDQNSVILDGGEAMDLGDQYQRVADMWSNRADTGYLVRYGDGYVSWSPTKPFEEGYTEIKE